MPRLVQADLATARNPEHRDQSPPLIGNVRGELDALGLELGHGLVDIVAHQVETVGARWLSALLVAFFRCRVNAQLGRRKREDQPARVGLDELESERVAEKRTGGVRVFRVDQGVDGVNRG